MLNMRLMFNSRALASQLIKANGVTRYGYRNVSSKKNVEEDINVFTFQDVESEEEVKAREAAIEQKRNKSQLFPHDYNKQHGRVPYEKPEWELHESLIYRRRLYGKYGESSKVDPSILWPSKTELAAMKKYEAISQPFTFQQLIDRVREKKSLAEKERVEAEAEVLSKVSRVKQELLEFHKRVAEKHKKAKEAMEHRNKLMQQVRDHFGFNMDSKDARFVNMLEKLQKEERSRIKAEQKAKREILKAKTFEAESVDKPSESEPEK